MTLKRLFAQGLLNSDHGNDRLTTDKGTPVRSEPCLKREVIFSFGEVLFLCHIRAKHDTE